MSGAAQDLEYFERTPVVRIVTTSESGREIVTPIWSVVEGGHVYIRNGHGPSSKWFGRVVRGHAAEFDEDGRRIPVTAEPVTDAATLARIDEAYRTKYADQGAALAMMLGAGPRGDTLRITPQAPRTPATGLAEHR